MRAGERARGDGCEGEVSLTLHLTDESAIVLTPAGIRKLGLVGSEEAINFLRSHQVIWRFFDDVDTEQKHPK
jgi:hypothetical protein